MKSNSHLVARIWEMAHELEDPGTTMDSPLVGSIPQPGLSLTGPEGRLYHTDHGKPSFLPGCSPRQSFLSLFTPPSLRLPCFRTAMATSGSYVVYIEGAGSGALHPGSGNPRMIVVFVSLLCLEIQEVGRTVGRRKSSSSQVKT